MDFLKTVIKRFLFLVGIASAIVLAAAPIIVLASVSDRIGFTLVVIGIIVYAIFLASLVSVILERTLD